MREPFPNRHRVNLRMAALLVLISLACGSTAIPPAGDVSSIVSGTQTAAVRTALAGVQAPVSQAPTEPATVDQRPRDLIVDGTKIIGANPNTVEGYLGKPTQQDIVAPANTYYDGIMNGGEEDIYQKGPYLINVDYDSKLGATGFGLEGIVQENWLLQDWPILLGRVGIIIQAPPDVDNSAMNLIWHNAGGYGIVITNDKQGGHIQGLSVFLCEYSTQFPCNP